MPITKTDTGNTIASLLAALFFYAAMSKLIEYEQSKSEMLNQVFPSKWAGIITWMVPATELIIAAALLLRQSQRAGLWAATLLLSAFSAYIAIVMTGIFGRIPCSCGGILKHMSYETHLLFNLFFVALGIIGIKLTNPKHTSKKIQPTKERRSGKLT